MPWRRLHLCLRGRPPEHDVVGDVLVFKVRRPRSVARTSSPGTSSCTPSGWVLCTSSTRGRRWRAGMRRSPYSRLCVTAPLNFAGGGLFLGGNFAARRGTRSSPPSTPKARPGESMSEHFVHEQGLCESKSVGEGTSVWAFAHVLPGARIGADCNICDQVFVESDVVVGDRVTVKCGVQLWDGCASRTTSSSDRTRRSPTTASRAASSIRATLRGTTIRRGASIGANATVLPGLDDRRGRDGGSRCGRDPKTSRRTRSSSAIPRGSSATSTATKDAVPAAPAGPAAPLVRATTVEGVTLHRLAVRRRSSRQPRRRLISATRSHSSPGACFMVYDVPGMEVRGEHAHRTCDQFLVCVHGQRAPSSPTTGRTARSSSSTRPTSGVYLPPMVWGIQYRYSRRTRRSSCSRPSPTTPGTTSATTTSSSRSSNRDRAAPSCHIHRAEEVERSRLSLCRRADADARRTRATHGSKREGARSAE